MARIKVHELAKELGAQNKEVIEYLSNKGYSTVRTAVSAVPENEIENIRAKFGGSTVSAAEDAKVTEGVAAAEAAEKGDQTSEEDAKGKHKSGIIRVYRSQNATKQLQKRPKSQAKPKQNEKQDVKAKEMKKPVETQEKAEEKKAAPVKEASKAEAVQAKPEEAAPVKTETAPVKEEKAPETEVKKTEAPSKTEEVKASEVKKEEPQSETMSATRPNTVKVLGHFDLSAKPQIKSSTTNDRGQRNNNRGSRNAQRNDRNGQNRDNQSRGPRNDRNSQGRDGQRNNNFRGDRNNQNRDGQRGGDRNNNFRGDRNNQNRDGQRSGDRNNNFRGDRNSQGGKNFNSQGGSQFRGGRNAAPVRNDSDGALVHKTARDNYRDTKDKDRTREERRENGRRSGNNSNRPNQQRRQFNFVPKALQKKNNNKPEEKKVEEIVTQISVPDRITIRDLADRMKIQASEIVKELFMKGEMVTVNHEIPFEKAEEIAMEHDILCEKEEKEDVIGKLLEEEAEDEKDLTSRPPVVCVMGHVDHGKTSLLDAIRDTHVTAREAGGITQAIGAYMVSIKGQKITFLDTPGHEAFTAMRMRGANSTDIAVLVVAADDGVMPQTVEAINHAKAAGVDIIVAVNKIDKPAANLDRVKQELSEYGLVAEDWGGDTIFCPVSAKTQEGIDNLLEMILLTAEVKELKANANRNARGIVLEAKLDKGRGPVASILVQKGTLHQGDFVACGAAHGKVRAMTDENGKRLHKATPSMPVEIIGLSSVPSAGEVLMSFDSDKEAKDFASVFVTEEKKNLLEGTKTQMSLDDLFSQIQEGSLKELPIVVKADVQGSVEAVSQSLSKLSNDEVVVKVIHGGVGAITESDVSLAAASNAIIIGFAVRPDATAKSMADQQNVDINLYSIIYEAIEDVERAINGMRAAVYEERIQGHVEIRAIFKASKIGKIAGSNVIDGIIQKNSKIRVQRGGKQIFEGELASLRIGKDDVKEVKKGFDCGLVIQDWEEFEEGDIVEAYTMVEVERKDEKKQS